MTDFRLAKPNERSELYPAFGELEYRERWQQVRDVMEDLELDAVIVYEAGGIDGRHIPYLTSYSPNFSTYLIGFRDPDKSPTLFVGISNHLQYVREKSVIDDLVLLLPAPAEKLVNRLREAGVSDGAIGLVGGDPRYGNGIPYQHYLHLQSALDAKLKEVTASFTSITAVKSDAEIDRIRRAASALDEAIQHLETRAKIGLSERDLRSILSSGISEEDARLGAAFISTAPMADSGPGECLPWKATPTSRNIVSGDIVTTEISAIYRGYGGQIHRPFSVGTSPTDRYREIFDLALETYQDMLEAIRPGNSVTDVHDALAPIEESECKIYDVTLHGYGNGYQHPFVGTVRSNYWPGSEDPVTANWVFEKNQVLVVQPNVVTPDERQGLQLGTTVVVREAGAENLQGTPVRFNRI